MHLRVIYKYKQSDKHKKSNKNNNNNMEMKIIETFGYFQIYIIVK